MHEYFPTHMIMENLNAYNKRFVVIFFRIYIFKIQTIKRPRPFEKNIQQVTSLVEAGYIVAKNSTGIMVSGKPMMGIFNRKNKFSTHFH